MTLQTQSKSVSWDELSQDLQTCCLCFFRFFFFNFFFPGFSELVHFSEFLVTFRQAQMDKHAFFGFILPLGILDCQVQRCLDHALKKCLMKANEIG